MNLQEIVARHHDEVRLLRLAIDDRDARIESLEAIVALLEQERDESNEALIAIEERYEGQLARLCAVYMGEVLP